MIIDCPVCFESIIPTISNTNTFTTPSPYKFLTFKCNNHYHLIINEFDTRVLQIRIIFPDFNIEGNYLNFNNKKVPESVWRPRSIANYTIYDVNVVINEAIAYIKYPAFL